MLRGEDARFSQRRDVIDDDALESFDVDALGANELTDELVATGSLGLGEGSSTINKRQEMRM